jgi:hypothetical protein
MSKELVNEIRSSGFGRLFDQQDYTYMVREILQILARNLDNTVPDYGLELYGLHNSPPLSEQGSGSIAAQLLIRTPFLPLPGRILYGFCIILPKVDFYDIQSYHRTRLEFPQSQL